MDIADSEVRTIGVETEPWTINGLLQLWSHRLAAKLWPSMETLFLYNYNGDLIDSSLI